MSYVILVAFPTEIGSHTYYSMLGHIPYGLLLSLIAFLTTAS